ncbi:MAG: cation transporter [Patescibacteria group bacterium]
MFGAIRSFLAWLSLSEVRRYGAVVASNFITILIQIVLVFASGSLALLSDTVHLGSDNVVTAGSLVVALISVRATKAADSLIRKWFAFSGIILLWIGAYHVLGEAGERMAHPVDIKNWWVLIGGILGGTGNLISLVILRTAPHGDHNHTHSILNWHVLFDFLFSVVVVISALLAITYDMVGVDTWISYRMALFMIGLGGFLFAQVLGGHEHHH